jgi:hypothetical protein
LILDRLSILALKHLPHRGGDPPRLRYRRSTASEIASASHLLEEQRSDLAACLNALWKEALDGKRRFKLYRQMKMYNDPELNPVVYAHKPKRKKAARKSS